ncbi:MarR family winged helix-turn-helix transcriptional regulator [Microlunatus elymi]|uniref:MarR family winged helix-turn-helix transcriptional regulator n=1 Tax=Microlunatus elymi TaxID=2596828 RepID=UPI00143D0E3C|nr:MarR family winged helix-turn-helix transcriptional regulator [Microlunatus elymi]
MTSEQQTAIELRLGGLFYLAHRAARATTNQSLKELAIDLRHLAVLSELADSGPLSQRELVDRTQMDKSSLVYVLDELERQGLAERRRNERDRRSHAVQLTAKGRRSLVRANAAAERAMSELLVGLSDRDKGQLDRLLTKLISSQK